MSILVKKQLLRVFRKFNSVGRMGYVVNRAFFKTLAVDLYAVSKKVRRRLQKRLRFVRKISGRVGCYSYSVSDTWVLQAMSYGVVSADCLEIVRRVLRRSLGKRVFVKACVSAVVSIFEKSSHSRMGKGKGMKFVKKVYHVCPGRHLFVVRGFRRRLRLRFLFKKLNFKVKWVRLNGL